MPSAIGRLGLLAGEGAIPLRLVGYCLREGIPVALVTFKGCVYEPFPSNIPTLHTPIEKVGKIFDFLKAHQVTDVVMIGNLGRPRASALKPDWRGVRTLARIGYALAGGGDDALLRVLRKEIEGEGFRVRGASDILPGLTMPAGVHTTQGFINRHLIDAGIKAAIEHGRADKGQAVLVHTDGTIDYETAAGTTALIRERGRKGAILVKMMKPGQDPDLDRPTVGVHTVHALADKECAGMLVEADAVYVVDRDDVTAAANERGIVVEAVHGGG